MKNKKVALLLAILLVWSMATPNMPIKANAGSEQQVAAATRASSSASLTVGRAAYDSWTESGIGYGVWREARTTGIPSGQFFQLDPTHGHVTLEGMSNNVAAWWFALDTRFGGLTQAIFHFDFYERPQAPETWNLTLSFDVDVQGENISVVTSFPLEIPEYGGTAVTTAPSVIPEPPTDGGGGNGNGGNGSGSGGGSDNGDRHTPRPSARPTSGPTSAPTSVPGNIDEEEPETTEEPEVPPTTLSPDDVLNLIQEDLDRALEEGIPADIVIPLETGTSNVQLYSENIRAIIESGGSLTIESDGISLYFDAAALAALGFDEDSIVTFVVRPADQDNEDMENTEDIGDVEDETDMTDDTEDSDVTEEENDLGSVSFNPIFQVASVGYVPSFQIASADDSWNDLLRRNRVVVDVAVDGRTILDPFNAMLNIDVSRYGFTNEQRERLIGVVYRSGTAVPLSGYQNLNGDIFEIEIVGSGEYGLMLSPDQAATPTPVTETPSSPAQGATSTVTATVNPVRTAELALAIGSTEYTRNGLTLQSEVAPYVGQEAMVPIRLVMESFGAEVDWDEATRAVIVIYQGVTYQISVDSPVPGGNVTPTIVNDRTLVPYSFITQTFGISADWNQFTQEISFGN